MCSFRNLQNKQFNFQRSMQSYNCGYDQVTTLSLFELFLCMEQLLLGKQLHLQYIVSEKKT